jgi:uncharacterized protein (TIGR03066 family)
MYAARLAVAGLLIFCVSGVAQADKKDKDDKTPEIKKENLYGTWKATKGLPEGVSATMTFTKDGKLTMVGKIKDRKSTVEGTYKLNGDKIEMTRTIKGEKKNDTITIVKLTSTTLVTKDAKRKESTFEKVKAKEKP